MARKTNKKVDSQKFMPSPAKPWGGWTAAACPVQQQAVARLPHAVRKQTGCDSERVEDTTMISGHLNERA